MQWIATNLGVVGYGLASLFFLFLSVLFVTGWRGRLQGGLLLLMSVISAIWAALSAVHAGTDVVPGYLIWAMEALRMVTILLFLSRLVEIQAESKPQKKQLLKYFRYAILGCGAVLILPWNEWFPTLFLDAGKGLPNLWILTLVLLSVTGLVLVEQVYHNMPWEHRWGIKYLCLGLGTILAYDFYLFSDALLFNYLDPNLWQARGAVNVLAVPLLSISAARNPQWSVDLFVSRKIVFHTTSIFAAGIYLLVMSLAGYYIRIYGGEWSRVLEIIFFIGAGIVLIVLLFSGQLQSRLRVFISKNFFSYKYDYREEWLRLIGILSNRVTLDAPLQHRVIHGLSEVVDSPGGAIWLCDEAGNSRFSERWNLSADLLEGDLRLGSLIPYLEQTQWVINLQEYEDDPEFYEGLDLPEWMLETGEFWLIVPLFHDDNLLGFTLLGKPRASQKLDWETLDLLKTAGCQAASYLALEKAANALAEARQFEGFNRLSAFVMHDLKNLIAQLSLVAKNAERHKRNPEFIDDAVLTIQNSVGKMNRLMAQLRGAIPGKGSDTVELGGLICQITEERSAQPPKPVYESVDMGPVTLRVHRDQLGSVLGHVIQNAQDAAGARGRVWLRLSSTGENALIQVGDNGIGMDKAFIKDRLFKPFDSTKGLTGMGIGAYECREYVTSLGGHVEVESEPGKGTLFSIYIPLNAVDTEVTV